MRKKLLLIYKKLYSFFGPQYWWPAKTAFEVMLGAILTQNTSWANVERAIKNLKKENLLSPKKINNLSQEKLASLLKPAGYYRLKASYLKNFVRFFLENYQGSVKKISLKETQALRSELLKIKGIGKETADSILLYALNKPIFVVDNYTKRILSRHKIIKEDLRYDETQKLFMQNLKKDVKLYNEFHALLVKVGKDLCLKKNPRCFLCPLKNYD